MKKLSFINKIIYIINSLVAGYLLFSYLLPYISPNLLPTFSILSLLVPILIVTNIIFMIYWILKLKKHFIISGLVLTIGYFFSPTLYKFSETASSFNDDIKLMSYNVRMFNHWKWIDDENISKKIKTFISDKSPDVLLFQEYYKLEKEYYKYPYKYIETKNEKANVGLAIYSKFPIINRGSLELENTSNNIIFVDILRQKDTIRVYNIHLQSLELNTDKENFGQENSEKLIGRLKEGFQKQAAQSETFLAHEKKWEGKKIIAGDFNNTSYSWVYNQICKNKKDAFTEAGNGFGKTFNYWFPMRIDFILTDEDAIINSFNSYSEKNSDHFPIQARINW